jgi:hypothetical protein
MDGTQFPDGGLSTVSITVLSVTPVRAGKLFAFAAVEIDIDGVRLEIHGVRASQVNPVGTKMSCPRAAMPQESRAPRSPCRMRCAARWGILRSMPWSKRGLAVMRTISNAAAA